MQGSAVWIARLAGHVNCKSLSLSVLVAIPESSGAIGQASQPARPASRQAGRAKLNAVKLSPMIAGSEIQSGFSERCRAYAISQYEIGVD